MKVAAIQMCSGSDVSSNLSAAQRLIERAARDGAQYVQLPEYCTYMGAADRYPAVAETVPGPTTEVFAQLARSLGIHVHVGSLLQRMPNGGKPANASVVIAPTGDIQAIYRKVHLFDIDVPGQVTERESDAVSAGDEVVISPVGELELGLAICFDLRFPALFGAMATAGANVFALPAAFAQATGSAHWEALIRARAIENHAFVVAAAQAGPGPDGWMSYGHSMIVDPWGVVLAVAPPDGEAVLMAELDVSQCAARRMQIPVQSALRPEVYGAAIKRQTPQAVAQ